MSIQVEGKSSDELLKEFSEKESHNTLVGEQYTAAIQVKSAKEISSAADRVQSAIIKLNSVVDSSTNNLKESIESFNETVKVIGESSDKLSSKLFWLNLILTVATVVATVVAILSLFRTN